MKQVDSVNDAILGVKVDLVSYEFLELKEEVKSWYKDYDLSLFDTRNEYPIAYKGKNNELIVNKISGIISNYFYAYKDSKGKMFLLDGYNRLLSNYGEITEVNPTVYVKVINDGDLPDNKLMSIMFSLNAWKLSTNGRDDSQFNIGNFLDRGFRLFLYTKFGIILNRRIHHDDIKVLDEYFRDESESVSYFNYGIDNLFRLFKQSNVIADFKEILKSNDYDTKEKNELIFPNYKHFLGGYVRFLSRRRLKGDVSEHLFDTYLNILKEDKKFFTKLKGMSGTDSTRKNIFLFFNKIEDTL